jgi:hypothetical protein
MMLTYDLETSESLAGPTQDPREVLSETVVLVPRTHDCDAAESAFMAALDEAREASHVQSLSINFDLCFLNGDFLSFLNSLTLHLPLLVKSLRIW